MTLRIIFLILCCLVTATNILAQSSYAPLNEDYYHLIERYEISSGHQTTGFETSLMPYRRRAIGHFVDSLTLENPSSQDKFNRRYLANDNWDYSRTADSLRENALLTYFFRRPSDFWHRQRKDITLHVNPVLHWELGQDGGGEGWAYTNTRGIQVHGTIDGKVDFYSYLGENQIVFPDFVNDYVRRTLTVPYEGFWKGIADGRGVDFLTARGHIGFQATRHIHFQLGHGKNFVGSGYRSMILSDFSNNYLFVRIDTDVWRLHYTNLFAQLTSDIVGNPTGLFGTVEFIPKYLAFHRLGVRLGKRVSAGAFEAVVHGNRSGNFDFDYINPIIFYRAVEQQGGSTGNALLGLDANVILGNSIELYGQVVLDELVISELRSGAGWWGNKYALQVGGKYIDALSVSNLDLQLEYNRARPYTYAHEDLYRSYTHYEQPLAHPLGANFDELVGIVRYQPLNRLSLKGKLIRARSGADRDSTNWGSNVLLDNRDRERDYGNQLRQGVATELLVAELIASYQVWHNVFVDLRYLQRGRSAPETGLDEQNRFVSLSLRWNIRQRNYDF